MTLAPGARLGSYEVIGALGAGGMGEVYRARDTKLGRNVAIKLLPDTFAHDPDRVARFKREAQILATLNHPHIAGIHGLEEANGSAFLVLEFVDGETLAEKLAAARPEGRSPKPEAGALSVAEALAIARQIVDALEAAHEKGIIHRDLKPANIMLTADGQVKVLDFGLAKQEPAGPGEAVAPGGLTHSPTLSFAATQLGMILGTAAYMSPEQAKGRPADKRSDVWAFGCVLYEMLAGRRAFDGEDVTDVIAAVVRGEPDWDGFPSEVPAHIRTIVKRCLVKDRKVRIPDMSVVRFMMNDGAAGSIGPGHQGDTRSPGSGLRMDATAEARRRRGALVWKAAAALFALTTVTGVAVAYFARSATPSAARFLVSPPEKGNFIGALGRPGAIARVSPDGRRLAFTAADAAGKTLLWVRPIDSLTAQPLAGTDDAAWPFWSSDSRQIAYSTPGKLMKIDAGGGPPQTLCALSGSLILARGGDWNREGLIVFSNGPGPLFRVSSAGGQPSPAFELATGQTSHVFPSFLPDGRHVLFYTEGTTTDVAGIHVASLDTGESKRLVSADTGGIYSPRSGYLLFVRQGTLLAQSFNPKTQALVDEPFPVAEQVEFNPVPGAVAFSVSENGVLAYGIGPGVSAGVQMVWVNRQGKAIETVGPEGNYRGLDLAPDGKRVAAHRHDGGGGDIWVSERSPGPTSRFTFDASQENSSPIWSPDGSRIVFGSLRGGKWRLYQKAANQASTEEQLVESDVVTLPVSWSPDGLYVVYVSIDPKTQNDLWLLPLTGDHKAIPWLQTPFRESHGQVSPNGKWLAYYSDETGRSEIYVQPFPEGAGKWQISTNGGVFPRWRGDDRGELFYMSQVNNGKLMAVEVRAGGSSFERGTPKELFDSGYLNLPHERSGPYHTYAVSADGERFLIPRSPLLDAESAGSRPIAVVLNWEVGLKQ